ncbi:cupin domain-containing protein [Sulfitobacter sp. LCG007]
MSEGERDGLIALPNGGGRRYEMGRLTALFKADEAETAAGYSVSEWILAPGQQGVGAHSHETNDEMFFVLAGTPELLTGESWGQYAAGAFLRIPAGMTHDFRNRSDAEARLLNLFIPGGFERDMPRIVKWFANNPD